MSKKFRGWIWLYSLLVLYSHTSTRWHWWGKAGSEDLLLQRQYVQFQLGVCFARTRGFLVHPFFSATLRTKFWNPDLSDLNDHTITGCHRSKSISRSSKSFLLQVCGNKVDQRGTKQFTIVQCANIWKSTVKQVCEKRCKPVVWHVAPRPYQNQTWKGQLYWNLR